MITAGAGNTLWFTENSTGPGGGVNVGAISTGGSAANYTPSPVQSGLADGIVQGPDGNYYFTEITSGGSGAVGNIVKATPSGAFTQYTIPTAAESSSYEGAIVVGTDHNLWFTVPYANKIGVMTTSGAFTLYTLPHSNSEPYGITVGADGNLWFTEAQGDRIGRITTAGVITEYNVPTAYAYPEGIAADAAGNVWFAEEGADKIGRLTASGVFSQVFRQRPARFDHHRPGRAPLVHGGGPANKIGTLDPTMPPDLPASINPNCGCPNMPGSVNVTSAAAIGPIVNEFTFAPVRYGDGVVDIAETDLLFRRLRLPVGADALLDQRARLRRRAASTATAGSIPTRRSCSRLDGSTQRYPHRHQQRDQRSYFDLVDGAYQAALRRPLATDLQQRHRHLHAARRRGRPDRLQRLRRQPAGGPTGRVRQLHRRHRRDHRRHLLHQRRQHRRDAALGHERQRHDHRVLPVQLTWAGDPNAGLLSNVTLRRKSTAAPGPRRAGAVRLLRRHARVRRQPRRPDDGDRDHDGDDNVLSTSYYRYYTAAATATPTVWNTSSTRPRTCG